MKNRYEGLLVLNLQGNEDGAKDTIERLEKDFASVGAEIEQVQKMDKRQFSYAAGELDHGYYVNFVFHGEPTVIQKLKDKFRLDTQVYRQNYLKVKLGKPKKVRKPPVAA